MSLIFAKIPPVRTKVTHTHTKTQTHRKVQGPGYMRRFADMPKNAKTIAPTTVGGLDED